MNIIKITTLVVLVATIIVSFVASVVIGIDRQEQVRCFQLQKQAENHQEFYITSFEKKVCDYQGIEVNAPVQ